MIRNAWKLLLQGSTRLGAMLIVFVVAAVGYFAWAQSNGSPYRKTEVLEMSWKRDDARFGPNFIHLESPCLSNSEPGCYCALEFRVTRTKEFADYIESFGIKKVPVKYAVNYDGNGQAVGAILESVGVWPAERFSRVEKALSLEMRAVRNQSGGGVLSGRLPADCFPKSVK